MKHFKLSPDYNNDNFGAESPTSVFSPNADRTVVSDNLSLAGMSFTERQLKPFSFVKQLTDFTIAGSEWTKHKTDVL